MGYSVGFLKLVKLLNSANDLSLKKEVIKTALDVSDAELRELSEKLASLGINLQDYDDSLSLSNKVDLLDDSSIFKRVSGAGRIEILIQLDVEPILKLGKGLKEDSQGALAIDESYLFQTLKIATKDDVEDRVNTKIQTVQTTPTNWGEKDYIFKEIH